jgi:hypothetical protein
VWIEGIRERKGEKRETVRKAYDAFCGIVFKTSTGASRLWRDKGRRLAPEACGIPPGLYLPFFKLEGSEDGTFIIMDVVEKAHRSSPSPWELTAREISRKGNIMILNK